MVIPCRNAAPFLESLLDSLCSQQVDELWEILLVDNGSADSSKEIARRYADVLPIKVFDCPGPPNESRARNMGVQRSRGPKILFVDADDKVSDDYVRVMSAALESADFVAARVDSRTLNPGWLGEVHGPPWQQDGLEDWFGFLPNATPCFGVKKHVYEVAGGWPEDYPNSAQDTAFSWRVQLSGTPLVFVGDAVYQYRFRTTASALYKQTRNWGKANAFLFRDFRSLGMPGRAIDRALRDWVEAVGALLTSRSKADLALALTKMGYCVGRLKGSVRYRVLYL